MTTQTIRDIISVISSIKERLGIAEADLLGRCYNISARTLRICGEDIQKIVTTIGDIPKQETKTVTRARVDRIDRLFRLGYITPEERDTAVTLREMFIKPLTRTKEYVQWATLQDSIIVDTGISASRMFLFVELVVQDVDLASIDNSLRMATGTTLRQVQRALADFIRGGPS